MDVADRFETTYKFHIFRMPEKNIWSVIISFNFIQQINNLANGFF